MINKLNKRIQITMKGSGPAQINNFLYKVGNTLILMDQKTQIRWLVS